MGKFSKLALAATLVLLGSRALAGPAGAATAHPPRYLPAKSFGLVAFGLEETEFRTGDASYVQYLGDKAHKKGVAVDATKNAKKYGELAVKNNPTKRKIHGKSVGFEEGSKSLYVGWVEKDLYVTVKTRGLTQDELFALAETLVVTGTSGSPVSFPKLPTGLESLYAGPKTMVQGNYTVDLGPDTNSKNRRCTLAVYTANPRYLAVWMSENIGGSEVVVRGKKGYLAADKGELSWMEEPNVFVSLSGASTADLPSVASALKVVTEAEWTSSIKKTAP
jgi:hypothetical protein